MAYNIGFFVKLYITRCVKIIENPHGHCVWTRCSNRGEIKDAYISKLLLFLQIFIWFFRPGWGKKTKTTYEKAAGAICLHLEACLIRLISRIKYSTQNGVTFVKRFLISLIVGFFSVRFYFCISFLNLILCE